jgi:hypothetical protein
MSGAESPVISLIIVVIFMMAVAETHMPICNSSIDTGDEKRDTDRENGWTS